MSLKITLPTNNLIVKGEFRIPLNNHSKEPPHVFIKKNDSIYYIQYDEIDIPLNRYYVDDYNEVHTPYLKNWNDKV